MMPDQRPRELHLTQLLPNLMTISAMCSGLTGIRFAVNGQFSWAVAMVLLAAVLDGLDGRVARLLKSESEMGAELDSFVDFVNFGVATGLVVYLWGLAGQQSGGWIATLVYASCCMLRLARFNIGSRLEKAEGEEKPAGSFTGVPAPAGAMLALLPMYVAFIWPGAKLPPVGLMVWILFVGGLMISRIPTPSFKSVTVYAENVRFVVIGFVAIVAALLTFPWQTMLVIDLAYIAIVLNSLWQFRKNRRGLRGL
jgi:CDP-diacylglycerol--serine O-phosphatidyltransferase